MRVREVMEPRVRTCAPEDDLATAIRIMSSAECGVLPVVSTEGEPVGIFTDRDVCLTLGERDEKPSGIRVREIMHEEVHVCRPEDDVQRALDLMRAWKVRRLPVVAEGRLVGILSLDELVLKAQFFETTEFRGPLFADIGTTLQAICEHPPRASH